MYAHLMNGHNIINLCKLKYNITEIGHSQHVREITYYNLHEWNFYCDTCEYNMYVGGKQLAMKL